MASNNNEMQLRLEYERALGVRLREANTALQAAVELHQEEILRLRMSVDQFASVQNEYERLKGVLEDISRNKIHGKPTVAAEIALSALNR